MPARFRTFALTLTLLSMTGGCGTGMRRKQVASSFIDTVGYDKSRKVLEVTIQGKVYEYDDVPPEIFKQFLDAPSKGQFLNQRVKRQFSVRRIR